MYITMNISISETGTLTFTVMHILSHFGNALYTHSNYWKSKANLGHIIEVPLHSEKAQCEMTEPLQATLGTVDHVL